MRASLPAPDAHANVLVVWLPMLPADNTEAAEEVARLFADTRVQQCYDGERTIGRAIARSLGAPPNAIAWDIYLLYDASSRWGDEAPAPAGWAHQLGSTAWADASRYATGDALADAIARLISGQNT